MRQNIRLTYEGSEPEENMSAEKESNCIYIYSHWDGGPTYKESGMAGALKDALSLHERWDDGPYLARIIFQAVIGDDGGPTGYGLSPYETDPEFPTITVNLEKRTVDGMRYEDFINSF